MVGLAKHPKVGRRRNRRRPLRGCWAVIRVGLPVAFLWRLSWSTSPCSPGFFLARRMDSGAGRRRGLGRIDAALRDVGKMSATMRNRRRMNRARRAAQSASKPTLAELAHALDALRLRVEPGREVERWYHAMMWLEAGDAQAADGLFCALRRTVVRRRARRLQEIRIGRSPRATMAARLGRWGGRPLGDAVSRLSAHIRRLRFALTSSAQTHASPHTRDG